MSRIGKQPITIPAGVTVTVANGNEVTVKGPKGELSRSLQKGITVAVDGTQVLVSRADDSRAQKSYHGLSRTLVKNMIEGVTQGYSKELVIHRHRHRRRQRQGRGHRQGSRRRGRRPHPLVLPR